MSMDATLRHKNCQSDESASLKNHTEKLDDSSIHGNMISEPAQHEPNTTPKPEISPLDGKDFISGSDVTGTLNISSLIPNSLLNNTGGVDSKKVNPKQIIDSEAADNLPTVLVEAMHIRSGAEVSEKLNYTPPNQNLLIDREIMHTEIQKFELEVDAQSKFVSSESAHGEYQKHEMGINNQHEFEESISLTDKLTAFSKDAFKNFSERVHSEDNNHELEIDAQTQVEEPGTKGPVILSDKQTSYSGNVSLNFTDSINSQEDKHELEISQGKLEGFGEKESSVLANEPSKDFVDDTRNSTGEHIETSLDDLKVSSTTENVGLQHEGTVCEINHGNLESISLNEAEYPKSEILKPTVIDKIENASNVGVGDKEISLPLVEGDILDFPPKTDSTYANLVQSVLPHGDANNADLPVPPEKTEIETSSQHEMGEKCIGSKKRRKSTAETPVSARVLRSRSKDIHEDPLPVATEVSDTVSKKRKRKRKQMKKSPVSEFSRERKHLRYLLQRIQYEQNLIEAYSSEGWRKQSLEKLKPEKELQRAKSHILRYKLKIRDLFQRLDLSLTEGAIPESLFDSEGEIDSEDIFCAKCGSKDVSLDNDIILCDGACERGFHQFCLEPPLQKEDIPQGDEGWLCPGCDCKDDCIDFLNDFSGVKLSVLDSWEKVFPEAAAATGKTLEDGSGLPSDDSEDDDYDPDKIEVDKELPDQETSSDDSDYHSASDSSSGSPNKPGSPAKDLLMGLPSDDSEDDDFDPNAQDDDNDDDEVKEKSSSDFTSDSEDLEDVLQDNTSRGDDQCQSNHEGEELEVRVKVNRQSLKDEISHLLNSNDSPISAKRHVERLDYKKLHDETYGNESSDSSDEDFGENVVRKGRRNVSGRISGKGSASDGNKSDGKGSAYDGNKSDGKGSASEGNKSDIKPEDGDQEQKRTAIRAKIQFDTVGGNISSASHANSSEAGSDKKSRSKPYKRLGEAVTQRLSESFKKNQYPKRPEIENLARDLGLTSQQVSKWFTNARWSSRHSVKTESNGTPGSLGRPTSSLQAKVKLNDEEQKVDMKDALSNENNIAASPGADPGEMLTQTFSIVVEPLIIKEPGEQKSGTPKCNKRKNVSDDDQPQQVRRSCRQQ